MTDLQPVPLGQRLDAVGVVSHAQPVVQVLLFLLIALIVASAAIWLGQFGRARRVSAAAGDQALSAMLVAAPLLGLTAAAYGLLDISIGIANVRPAPDLTRLAPGLAEASLCVLLGLLAASLAAAFRTHLRLFGSRQPVA